MVDGTWALRQRLEGLAVSMNTTVLQVLEIAKVLLREAQIPNTVMGSINHTQTQRVRQVVVNLLFIRTERRIFETQGFTKVREVDTVMMGIMKSAMPNLMAIALIQTTQTCTQDMQKINTRKHQYTERKEEKHALDRTNHMKPREGSATIGLSIVNAIDPKNMRMIIPKRLVRTVMSATTITEIMKPKGKEFAGETEISNVKATITCLQPIPVLLVLSALADLLPPLPKLAATIGCHSL